MALKERGKEAAVGLSTKEVWKIDVPANRYDILSLEGMAQALNQFTGRIPPPVYTLNPPAPTQKLVVKASVCGVRPFVLSAILRNVTFTEESYKSFIDLQDKLHQNICRKRTLVSMGTHDLDTLQGPFTYEALPPEEINFVPLRETQSMNGRELMEHLSTHQQLKTYLAIIRDKPLYPVIMDANRVVGSLPPVINSEHSKITIQTRNIFFDVTGTDFTKVSIVLNTLLANFSELCEQKYEIEPVLVEYEQAYESNAFVKSGQQIISPFIQPRIMDVNVDRLQRDLNIRVSNEEVRSFLRCMSLPGDFVDKHILRLQVPVTRSDVMHEVDVLEDLAIAYGYDNLEAEVPATVTNPKEQPVNHLTDLLRMEFALAGWYETYNWALCSHKDCFESLKRESCEGVTNPYTYVSTHPVRLSNPKTREFEIVRVSLLPGLLKSLAHNEHNARPLRLFELGDCVLQDVLSETGAKNQRRACALISGVSSTCFEQLHGLLDQVMMKLNLRARCDDTESMKQREWFELVDSQDPAFFPGRQANIVVKGVSIGILGVLHPEVLLANNITHPTSALEFNVEPFLDWL